jgi:hypothetical protein
VPTTPTEIKEAKDRTRDEQEENGEDAYLLNVSSLTPFSFLCAKLIDDDPPSLQRVSQL